MLELIVRPFQQPLTLLPLPKIAAQYGLTGQRLVAPGGGKICFGGVGALPTPTIGKELPTGTDTLTETQRKSVTIRVYQNNDPSSGNWVDLERPTEIDFGNKGQKVSLVPAYISYVAADLSAYDQEEQKLFQPFDSTIQATTGTTVIKLNNTATGA